MPTKNKSRRLWWGVLLVAVLMASAIAASRMAGAADPCAGGFPRQATVSHGRNECPVLGNIGGIKLAIPRSYLFGPVAYEGEDIWSAQSAGRAGSHSPSFAREIKDFAILVRQSDYRPIETKRDLADFEKRESIVAPAFPPPENRWLIVGLKSGAAHVSPPCRNSMKCYLGGILTDAAGWGPFVLQPGQTYGLDHYRSLNRPTVENRGGKFDEFYYDRATDNSLITCSTKPMIPSPHVPLEHCNHNFAVPELHVQVDIDYDHPANEALAHWRDVERNVRLIVDSFIVP